MKQENNTKPLRDVIIHGPVWQDQPFWVLHASSPAMFNYLNESQRVQEDRVHPLRSLAMDMTATATRPGFHSPNMLTLQILAGYGKACYRNSKDFETFFNYQVESIYYDVETSKVPPEFEDYTPFDQQECRQGIAQESFSISLKAKQEVLVPAKMSWKCRTPGSFIWQVKTAPSLFCIGKANDSREEPKQPAPATFQQVVVEPILDKNDAWPIREKGLIHLPAMRLLEGSIDLAVADGAFPWLSQFLQPDCVGGPSAKSTIHRFPFTLTPDGIELTTQVSFLDASLRGCFLLAPEKITTEKGLVEQTKRLLLTLLPEKTAATDLQAWQAQWNKLIPAQGEEERLHGFRIAGQRNSVPAFRWEVLVAADGMSIAALSEEIEIPAQHLRLEMLSPADSNASVDGVVNVAGGYFSLKKAGGTQASPASLSPDSISQFVASQAATDWVLLWRSKEAENTSSQLKLHSTLVVAPATATATDQLDVSLLLNPNQTYDCAYDEYQLADALRQAYGLPGLSPGAWAQERPLLYGFVPMKDGWLQLPIPNTPPLAPSNDAVLQQANGPANDRNVLRGFLRFTRKANFPSVQSAFTTSGAANFSNGNQAPWSITVEGARRLQVAVALRLNSPNNTGSTPVQALALLDDPELSTRGLLWFSADRPDAQEALPRLGAGPGKYLDVPLKQQRKNAKPIVQVAIEALSLSSTRNGNTIGVARNSLKLGFWFDKKQLNGDLTQAKPNQTEPDSPPYYWRRHPWLPLLTQMPITRNGKTISVAHNNSKQEFGPNKKQLKEDAKRAEPDCRAYYWRRHPWLPLVSQMPMTRSATSAVQPLESRELIPFSGECIKGELNKVQLAQLAWDDSVFASMASLNLFPSVAPKWPWPEESTTLNASGIGLCAFGVPGVELLLKTPTAKENVDPWHDMQMAARFDLPLLDEAFATAGLPPSPEQQDSALNEQNNSPIPTALDWPALTAFWEDQNRRHQLARVAHSYLAEYRAINDLRGEKISSLIGGLTWDVKAFGFADENNVHSTLRYGRLCLHGQLQTGNQALLGLTKNFSIMQGQLSVLASTTTPQPTDIQVLGYSPGFWQQGAYLMDARGSGSAQVAEIPTGLSAASVVAKGLWRAVKTANANENIGLFSCAASISVASDRAGTRGLFRFFCKDIPLNAKGEFSPTAGIEPKIWQDEYLPFSGMEWRLLPETGEQGFADGSDSMPFYRMQLEPLCLLGLTVLMSNASPISATPSSVRILARLRLTTDQEIPDIGSGLIELTLAQNAAGLYLQSVKPRQNDLRLPMLVAENQVTVRVGNIAWNSGHLSLRQCHLQFDFLGQRLELACDNQDNIEIAPDTDWVLSATTTIAHANSLQITEAVLAVQAEPQLTIQYKVQIHPVSETGVAADNSSVTVEGAQIWCKSTSPVNTATPAKLVLLGAKAKVMFKAERSAFCITTGDAQQNYADLEGALLPGFPTGGGLRFGLLASIGEFYHGTAALLAGYLSGTLWGSKAGRMHINRIDFEANCQPSNDAPTRWIGALSLYGHIKVRNAIRWPKVDLANSSMAIPFPGANTQSGRGTVRLKQDEWYVHDIQWLLDGHRLPFEVAQGMLDHSDKTVWTVPVMAQHRLETEDGKSVYQFVGIETLGMGAMAALVPPWPSDADPTLNDAKSHNTFAPRYQAQIINGNIYPGSTPGMLNDGRGGWGTVLQGALSAAFRVSCYAKGAKASDIVLVGGFVGMLLVRDAASAPLLRLPVLASLEIGEKNPLYVAEKGMPPIQQIGAGNPPNEWELAWSDTAAAPELQPTPRSAISPKSGSATALYAALAQGARTLPKQIKGDPVMAVLVEQSFPKDFPAGSSDAFASAPFFIAAAVSIERALRSLPIAEQERPILVLSLLAGTVYDDELHRHSHAAALLTRSGKEFDLVARPPQLPAHLTVVAENLAQQVWNGPDSASGAPFFIASKAYAMLAHPRAAMLRDKIGVYFTLALPAPALDLRSEEILPPAFADAGRGFALEAGDTTPWLAGPEDASGMPLRDYHNGKGSGIAGFSRVAALRSSALDIQQKLSQKPVWLGQQRVPVYLPLQTTKLEGPAVPWLTPGAPRNRLPVDAEVNAILEKTGMEGEWQAVVPDQLMSASISDRPGILIAHRLRLETSFSGDLGSHDFDSDHSRFGQAAQAGSSFARTERTPRPGPLPPNTATIRTNRRPCASPLLPFTPLRALIGPADTVRGMVAGLDQVAWSVTFVAAPETRGVITEGWDGTLGLVAEIDVASGVAHPADTLWAAYLFGLLFGLSHDQPSPQTPLLCRAALMIGNQSIPFTAMHVMETIIQKQGPDSLITRVRVKLVLDARSTPQMVAGAALPAVAALLSGSGPLPSVVLQLTVHPAASAVIPTAPVEGTYLLDTNNANTSAGLNVGKERAPVSLRMALSPVLRDRGALPLQMASLLFIDSAYDNDLAAPPLASASPVKAVAAGSRGRLALVLYADRQRVNRRASITLMADVRYEKRMDERLQASIQDQLDGDLKHEKNLQKELVFRISIQTKTGTKRDLYLAGNIGNSSKMMLAHVYELALNQLCESDGSPAQLFAGDMLVLQINPSSTFLHVSVVSDAVTDFSNLAFLDIQITNDENCILRLILTDEPVIEPPPALYAALMRSEQTASPPNSTLSVPLYAQSPLPWRVDLMNAKADFRAGLMHRSATFIWTLGRPSIEFASTSTTSIHIVKSDRNGQIYLPAIETISTDFIKPEQI